MCLQKFVTKSLTICLNSIFHHIKVEVRALKIQHYSLNFGLKRNNYLILLILTFHSFLIMCCCDQSCSIFHKQNFCQLHLDLTSKQSGLKYIFSYIKKKPSVFWFPDQGFWNSKPQVLNIYRIVGLSSKRPATMELLRQLSYPASRTRNY